MDLTTYTDAELTHALTALRTRLRSPLEGLTDEQRKVARTQLMLAGKLKPSPMRRMVRKWLDRADDATRTRLVELLKECGVRT